MSELTVEHFLFLSAALFVIGMVGILIRRNVLVIFMCVEMMLASVSITFVAFAWEHNQLTGQIFALFIIALAAAESVVGLGILLALSRRLDSVDINSVRELRE